jgi:hypothetical protein
MIAADSETIIRAGVEAWNSGAAETIRAVYTDDIVHHDDTSGSHIVGIEDVAEMATTVMLFFPSYTNRVTDWFIGSEDILAVYEIWNLSLGGEEFMAKIEQTLDELKQHLKEQIMFLQSSALSYDDGFTGEAKRLAVTVRVLLHDTNGSKSLLKQLGMKEMPLLDTSTDFDPKNRVSHSGLVIMKSSPQGQLFVPKCTLPPRPGVEYPHVCFDDWWEKLVVVDSQKNQFTRRDLVLFLANKVGGAHVDPKLDEAYVALTRQGSIGWNSISKGKSLPLIETASMRQIAYELLTSFEQTYPEYF